MEKFVRVAAQECPREDCNVSGGRSQGPESIPLGRIPSLQFVNFIRDGVIEEPVAHVPPDEVDGCKAADLLSICLPKRAVERPAGVICSFPLAEYFAELCFLEVH